MLDRIDIHLEVPSVRYQELTGTERGESSAMIRARVMAARRIQQERYKDQAHVHCNADMRSRDLTRYARLEPEAADLLKMAITELNFSARAYDRILKVARTIADLDGGPETIRTPHISEAIQYRTLDRQMWK